MTTPVFIECSIYDIRNVNDAIAGLCSRHLLGAFRVPFSSNNIPVCLLVSIPLCPRSLASGYLIKVNFSALVWNAGKKICVSLWILVTKIWS